MNTLSSLVCAEPAITRIASAITPVPEPWGQSGALHYTAIHTDTGMRLHLKLHVSLDQLWWTQALAIHGTQLIPHVYATGTQLGSNPIAWILQERVAGGLHPGWHGREFDMLLEAGVQFQQIATGLAQAAQAAGVLHTLTLAELTERLARGIARAAPGPSRRVLERLPEDWHWLTTVCEPAICHGDLHMANAVCRDQPPAGHALLIDYHPTWMPWAYEPARPEILNAEPSRAGCRNLVVRQAAMRQAHGLAIPSPAIVERLQALMLGWAAIEIWGYLGPDTNPAWRDPAIWYAENAAYIQSAASA